MTEADWKVIDDELKAETAAIIAANRAAKERNGEVPTCTTHRLSFAGHGHWIGQ
ncbi:MAG: hypothetical protein AAF495_15825 [Pseudomonadota bacterium]